MIASSHFLADIWPANLKWITQENYSINKISLFFFIFIQVYFKGVVLNIDKNVNIINNIFISLMLIYTQYLLECNVQNSRLMTLWCYYSMTAPCGAVSTGPGKAWCTWQGHSPSVNPLNSVLYRIEIHIIVNCFLLESIMHSKYLRTTMK